MRRDELVIPPELRERGARLTASSTRRSDVEAAFESPDEEVNEQLAQRTRELATPKDESERSERESWRIIDSIPGSVALLTKTGEVDMVNR